MALIATLKVQEGPRGKANIFDMKQKSLKLYLIKYRIFYCLLKLCTFLILCLNFPFNSNSSEKFFQHRFMSVIFKLSLGIKTGVE